MEPTDKQLRELVWTLGNHTMLLSDLVLVYAENQDSLAKLMAKHLPSLKASDRQLLLAAASGCESSIEHLAAHLALMRTSFERLQKPE
jgi:hypothetical protein